MANLSEKSIKAIEIPPGAIRLRVKDDGMRGLYLMVGKQTKTWEIKRKGAWYRLGSHPSMTVTDARAAALDVIKRLDTGRPLNLTVQAAHDLWVKAARKPRAARTLEANKNSLNKQFADWKNRKLETITRPDVVALFDKLSTKRGNRGGPGTANNALSHFSRWWREAMRQDPALPVSPTVAINWHPPAKKDESHLLANLKEWDQRLDTTITNPVRLVLYRFALLTGLRANDLRTMRWEHIEPSNDDGVMLRLPKPKGGAGRAFAIPLATAHIELLAAARAAAARPRCPWVFPAAYTDGTIRDLDLTTMERRAFGDMPWTPHSLRRAFISLAFESGNVTDVQVKLLVNHNVPGVTGTYVARHLNLRPAMEQIVAHIQARLA